GKRKAGEHFSHGADVEHAVAVHGARVVAAKLAMDDDAAPLGLDDTDRHPNAVPPPLDPLDQNLEDGGVWWHWRVRMRWVWGIFDHQEPAEEGDTPRNGSIR